MSINETHLIFANRMNKFKLVAALIGVVASAVIAFGSTPERPPTPADLKTFNGVLLSANFSSKTGTTFRVEGLDVEFRYMSYGRLCGNVYEQLLDQKDKRISFKYTPAVSYGLFRTSNASEIFEIASESKMICSFESISQMRSSGSSSLGLVGFLMLLVCTGLAITAAADIVLQRAQGK